VFRALVVIVGLTAFPGLEGSCQESGPKPLAGEPYVYTEWESFTTESTNGALVNDHIFFLEADGDSLWIGTEGGLVLYYNGTWQSWTEEDGLPWNVIMGIAKDEKTGQWAHKRCVVLHRYSGRQRLGRIDCRDQSLQPGVP